MIVRLLQAEGDGVPLDRLPEDSQVRLTRAMGAMGPISHQMLDQVVTEFTGALEKMALPAASGMAGALSLLDGKLSPAAAARLKEEAARGDPAHAWAKIAALPLDRLDTILQSEGAEIAALVLSKLPVARAADLLMKIPGARARQITTTTALLEQVTQATAARIAHALVAEYCVEHSLALDETAVQRVASVLNATGRERRDDILIGLEEDDPDFAKRVRQAIFVFANIPARLDPKDIPALSRLVAPEQFVLCIAGALQMGAEDAAAAEYLLANMSGRLAEQIRDEAEQLGPIKPTDAEEAHAMLVQAIRDQADAGEITLRSEDDAAKAAA